MGTRNPNKFAEKAQEAVKMDDVTKLINVVKRAEILVDTFGRFIDMQVRKQDIFNALDPRDLDSKKSSREIEK